MDTEVFMELLLYLGFWFEQLLTIGFTTFSQQRNPDTIIFCHVIST